MKRGWSAWLVIGCLALLGALTAAAEVSGTILGTVKDSSGAVIPGVQVVARNEATGLEKSSMTDASGAYRIQALPVGRYSVRVAHTGFKDFVEEGVVLTVDEQRRIDVVMQVGSTSEQVSVSANAAHVETTDTQLGQVINEKQISQMPLNGRSFLDLFGLQPGVAPAASPGNASNQGPGTFSVNGEREQSNGFLINGADVSGGANFEAGVQPNLDSIEEFRLLTDTFDAEYGRFSGAIMNTVTKSGTNSIHGTVFEFLRNDAMDSKGYFAKTKGALKKNQYGFAVGGPAIKNKLFWFTDYQGDRQVNGGAGNTTLVPTNDERQGKIGVEHLTGTVTGTYWAQVLSQRLGKTVTDGEPYSSVFPDGNIPTSAFSPAAVGTLRFIPAPNVTGNSGYNFVSVASIDSIDHKIGQRVDFNTAKTGDWSAYYHMEDFSSFDPYGGGANSFPTGFGSANANRDQLATLSNTLTINPTAVNLFRLSYTRIVARVATSGAAAPSLSSMGFVTGTGTLGINNGGPPGFMAVPDISLNNFNFGEPGTTNSIQNTYAVADNFTKVVGRHTLKFGGEYRYYQLNNRNGSSFLGSFSFDGGETGYDVADYLLGSPTSYSQNSVQQLDGRSKYGGAFIQDSIRVTPNLTLNAGLRWEFSTPWYDTQDKIQTIVPGEQSVQYPNAPIGLVYPGDPGVSRTLGSTQYNHFAPRFGLAYAPTASTGLLGKLVGAPGKTSIRFGSGLFYNAIQDQTLYWIIGGLPFSEYWSSSAPPLFEEPFRTRSTGASQGQKFPYVIPQPGSQAARNFDFTPYLPLGGQIGYDIHNKLPYGIHYNVTLQRELAPSLLFSIGYVGSVAHHLISLVEANPGDPNLCMSLRGSGVMAGTLQCGRFLEDQVFTRPDGSLVYGTRGPLSSPNTAYNAACNCDTFGSSFYERNGANSSYNSLQTTLQKSTGNLTFLVGYTWSKSLDNGSFFNNRTNYENPALSRGLSNFDVTNNFVASYIYTIPFEEMFSGAPGRLVKGWAIAGITRLATGFPVTLFGQFDQSLRGTSGLDTPDLTGEVHFVDPRKPIPCPTHQSSTCRNVWMTAQGFSLPPLGSFGNTAPRFFHGPGFDNWNMALHKDTLITERVNMQFRAEFFNAFNHTQFANPNGYLGGTTFGVISSVQPNSQRVGQVALKFQF